MLDNERKGLRGFNEQTNNQNMAWHGMAWLRQGVGGVCLILRPLIWMDGTPGVVYIDIYSPVQQRREGLAIGTIDRFWILLPVHILPFMLPAFIVCLSHSG